MKKAPMNLPFEPCSKNKDLLRQNQVKKLKQSMKKAPMNLVLIPAGLAGG